MLRAVAAHGLPGSRLALPDSPLAGAEWEALFSAAIRQRLLGHLVAAVADGALGVTQDQFDRLAGAHCMSMGRALDIEAAAQHATETLEAAGVGVRILKGLATAHLDATDPSRREFVDVDLLVQPGRFAEAVEALTGAGMSRDLPERRRGFDARFGKEVTLYGRHQVEIDLHRTLALGAFGLSLDPNLLWDEGEAFDLGGRAVLALTPERRLLHACYSGLLGDHIPRLVALRDIAHLAGRSDVDGSLVLRLARGGRGEVVVARAVRLAGDALGTGPGWALWDWSGRFRAGRWERLCLGAYESQGGSNTATLLSGLIGLKGMGRRTAYAWALAFPDRAYVGARRRLGRPPERRHGLRELLRSLRRASVRGSGPAGGTPAT